MFYRPPDIVKRLFPQVTWDHRGDDSIFLTFDDGPHPEITTRVLQVLADCDIRATFFLIGKNVEDHSEVVRMIHDQGHQIGNHTFHHYRLLWRSRDMIRDEISRTENAIFNIIHRRTTLFRPPHGLFDGRLLDVAGQLGYKVVMWSLLSGDFGTRDPDRITKRAAQDVHPGSIVVFHDNWKTKDRLLPALSETIHLLQEKGLSFRPL